MHYINRTQESSDLPDGRKTGGVDGDGRPVQHALDVTHARAGRSRWRHAKALVCLITGQTSYCDQAVATARAKMVDNDDSSDKPGNLALVSDSPATTLHPRRSPLSSRISSCGETPRKTKMNHTGSGGLNWSRPMRRWSTISLPSYTRLEATSPLYLQRSWFAISKQGG